MNYAVWGYDELGKELGDFLKKDLIYDNLICYTDEKIEYANVLYTTGAIQTIEIAALKKVTTKTEKQYVDVTVNTTTVKEYTNKLTNTKTEKEYTDPTKKVTEDCHDERIKDPVT